MDQGSQRAACEARLGTTLNGKWTLERLLGLGGMAAVYEATHKIGRKEAIKILHPEVARSKELVLRFEQEARATNKLSHPGAVEIRDTDTSEEGCPFLVMELLEGENLAQRAARLDGLPREELLQYVDELLDVLAAAHALGIIHRDIKLDNLFVTTDQRLKVLDFGIARVLSGPQLTRLGARLGTTAYMAPEQVIAGEVDCRTDVFAVGATMFRVIAKRRVHEAPTEPELLVKMGADRAPPLATVAPGVDAGLALVVDRALQFRREDRYPSALAMQGDVRALRAGEDPPFARARADQEGPSRQAAQGAAGAFPAEPTFATDPTRAEAPAQTPILMEPTSAAPPPTEPDAPASVAAPPSMGAPTSLAAPYSVAAPTSLGPSRRAQNTVAIAAAPPSGTPVLSAATPAASTPAPGSFAAPSAFSAHPNSAPITPQAFGGTAPQRRAGSSALVAALVALVALVAIGGGLFVWASLDPTSSKATAEDDETSDEPSSKKKREKAKPAATAGSAKAAAEPQPAPAPTPPPREEERREPEAQPDPESEPPEPQPTHPGEPAKPPAPSMTQRPSSTSVMQPKKPPTAKPVTPSWPPRPK